MFAQHDCLVSVAQNFGKSNGFGTSHVLFVSFIYRGNMSICSAAVVYTKMKPNVWSFVMCVSTVATAMKFG